MRSNSTIILECFYFFLTFFLYSILGYSENTPFSELSFPIKRGTAAGPQKLPNSLQLDSLTTGENKRNSKHSNGCPVVDAALVEENVKPVKGDSLREKSFWYFSFRTNLISLKSQF
uniref:Putative salivary lipocalin n=1 Tax=Ixodes ricinus TaxID=34613 RepID=A0A147BFK9_IXORI